VFWGFLHIKMHVQQVMRADGPIPPSTHAVPCHAPCSLPGLATFEEPALPYDLNEGYPDAYVRKPADAASPVDTVVRAALAALAEAAQLLGAGGPATGCEG
jgi:hypothetical protein